MSVRLKLHASCLIVISLNVAAQVMSIPSSGFGNIGSAGVPGAPVGLGLISPEQLTNDLFLIRGSDEHGSPLYAPSGSISRLDLKAPGKARREYEKGYQLLQRKDWKAAVDKLSVSTSIYPKFVAAHNSLGTAYLSLKQDEQARDEFVQAIALDDHLPVLYLNLGCAQLALKQYPEAEESLKKATAIAPLDLVLQSSLAYGQFMNHNYDGVISTARQVHDRKHEGAAKVHYFAAAAYEAQDNLPLAQHEMELLLHEDPKSPSASEYEKILDQIQAEQLRRSRARLNPSEPVKFEFKPTSSITPEEDHLRAQKVLQDLKERKQIAEAETEPDSSCAHCGATEAPSDPELTASLNSPFPEMNSSIATLHATADEVAIFFAATDHGRSVSDLAGREIGIRDDNQAPAAILGFRNESQLPLRLALIIDTSDSITSRFAFEQAAAAKFLEKVVTKQDDLAFVVGVSNSVLVVQDFTADQAKSARAIGQLAPGGGTALWDAVAYSADKLASRPEAQPVARIVVVISDGEDNSSSMSFKQAIEHAQRGEVAVYTVSTRDGEQEQPSALLGDHALRTLSELTGGASFSPGSVRRLNGSLTALQEVIRGRYLVSYKPAAFQRNGHYRPIEIHAEKDGHKLKIYSRKGYYAAVAHPPQPTP